MTPEQIDAIAKRPSMYDDEKWVGPRVPLTPEERDGLIARVRAAETQSQALADETLQLKMSRLTPEAAEARAREVFGKWYAREFNDLGYDSRTRYGRFSELLHAAFFPQGERPAPEPSLTEQIAALLRCPTCGTAAYQPNDRCTNHGAEANGKLEHQHSGRGNAPQRQAGGRGEDGSGVRAETASGGSHGGSGDVHIRREAGHPAARSGDSTEVLLDPASDIGTTRREVGPTSAEASGHLTDEMIVEMLLKAEKAFGREFYLNSAQIPLANQAQGEAVRSYLRQKGVLR